MRERRFRGWLALVVMIRVKLIRKEGGRFREMG